MKKSIWEKTADILTWVGIAVFMLGVVVYRLTVGLTGLMIAIAIWAVAVVLLVAGIAATAEAIDELDREEIRREEEGWR